MNIAEIIAHININRFWQIVSQKSYIQSSISKDKDQNKTKMFQCNPDRVEYKNLMKSFILSEYP